MSAHHQFSFFQFLKNSLLVSSVLLTACVKELDYNPNDFLTPQQSNLRVQISTASTSITFFNVVTKNDNVKSCIFRWGDSPKNLNNEIIGKSENKVYSAVFQTKDFGKTFYVCSYITNGIDEQKSDPVSFSIPSFDSFIKFGSPVIVTDEKGAVEFRASVYIADGINLSKCGFRYGDSADNLTGEIGAKYQNGSITAPAFSDFKFGKKYYFCVFVRDDSNNLAESTPQVASIEPPLVDLGLSVKWSAYNLGATSPEGFGDYFAWGETSPKLVYTWDTYLWTAGSETSRTKYNCDPDYGVVDYKTRLDEEDDAAHMLLGGNWRMPTYSEMKELVECKWEWVTINGVEGYKVTGTKSGYTDKSIFLPAAGYMVQSQLSSGNGRYLSSTSYSDQRYVGLIYFSKNFHSNFGWTGRYCGCSIRPVCGSPFVPVTRIELGDSQYSVKSGGEVLTIASKIYPVDATDKTISWYSTDLSVACVDNGQIIGVSEGSCKIIAYATNGVKAECTVIVTSSTKVEPQYVDLGLSVKWATFNIGASKPEMNGYYFAWGETSPKAKYDIKNYKWWNASSSSYTKYVCDPNNSAIDYKTELDDEDDAANVLFGPNWHIPSDSDWYELSTCKWQWTTVNGVKGYKITGTKSGYTSNSIFLPAAGKFINDLSLYGVEGHYWTSSQYDGDAKSRVFTETSYRITGYGLRTYGYSIRPVYSTRIKVSSVKISQDQANLVEGDVLVLSANVTPSDAYNKEIHWLSNDESVALVSSDGIVIARSEGTCQITAYASNGVRSHCKLTVSKQGVVNPQYVDLGLSVKWATFNLGGIRPESYGHYYSWGELEPKQSYSISNYKWYVYDRLYTKYVVNSSYGAVDGKTTLELADDAARAKWGGKWRIPTYSEILELYNNCSWSIVTRNGILGYLATSKKSGYTSKSIFFPLTGQCFSSSSYSSYSSYYYSSSLNTNDSSSTNCIELRSYAYSMATEYRYYGCSIRPVTE